MVESMVKLNEVSPNQILTLIIAAIIVSLIAGNIIFALILVSIALYLIRKMRLQKKSSKKV